MRGVPHQNAKKYDLGGGFNIDIAAHEGEHLSPGQRFFFDGDGHAHEHDDEELGDADDDHRDDASKEADDDDLKQSSNKAKKNKKRNKGLSKKSKLN